MRPPRHLASFGASIFVHAALIALIFYLAPRLPQGHDWVLAYVVEIGGGRGGAADAKGSGGQMELVPMPDRPPSLDSSSPPLGSTPSILDDGFRPVPRPGVIESLTAAAIRPYGATRGGASDGLSAGVHGLGRGGHSSGTGQGDGTGSGTGDGNGIEIAHADYGANPAPQYPARSRRRAEQGTVILHVLVAADGLVKRVEIAESSGFDDLDRAALETVRIRWRFVPARHDGHPVESWVLVPIRFALR